MPKKLNILHVDDSEAIISLVKLMLLRGGKINRILPARTVDEAKKILVTEKTDIVILDIHLPDGNGISLLKYIKENYPHVKALMLTNHSDSYFRDAARKAGAEYFFDKSTEFEEAAKAISACMLT